MLLASRMLYLRHTMARAPWLTALVIASACAESRSQAPTKSISVETSCLGSQSEGISNHCYPGNNPLGDAGAMIAKDASTPTGGSVATTVQAEAGVACAPTACPIDQAWNAASCRCEGHCDPFAELAARLGSSKPVDCGTLQVNALAADVLAARTCALDALAAKRPFQLIEWTEDDENRRTANLYAYAGADGFVSVFGYLQIKPPAMTISPANGELGLYEERCKGLQKDDDHMCASGAVCLACKDLVESSWTCDAPPAPGVPCLPVGTYARGKGPNPGRCCAPLREVSQMDAVSATPDAARVCEWPVHYALFACVEGSCGDGRCEEPERVECGCKLDCADADAGLE